ncbi:poly(A) RNA polymerase, mitochondrial [Salarias fasciatus]|uniref:Uncharacterized protein n=1 Tax=Salarias fasciatus TaxID=181472 RepID=A0A672JI27_SALFA|nr:poly(A) RNA polymerase, mitochondrial [Salarias fasciatus]
MAASMALCRLHMRGKFVLERSLQRADAFLQRSLVTEAVSAEDEAARKLDPGVNGRKSLRSLQQERREQAERSVLVSCGSTTERKFLKFLSRHGDVSKCFFYESYGVYAVVEFSGRDGVASLLEAASIPSASHEATLPFKSRLLSFRTLGAGGPAAPAGLKLQPQTAVPINELIQRLSRQDSIDQQVSSLVEAYQLTEENIRLRFLVCSLLKDVAAAYFPECSVKPFGSSVNGFGKLGCDLDMFLDLDGLSGLDVKPPKSGPSLEFQMKRASSERAVTQSVLSVVGECVDQFAPGCVGVQKILNARCPLVRFAHQPSGFQCDLTANNRVAMKSTELLYLFGELDPRVRALVFTVRCWARAHGVTSSIPGAWISNFSLTVMVLFFLQRRSPALLPTLDRLRELAGPADRSVLDGSDCSFTSDFGRIGPGTNTETAEQLLVAFFDFYSSFPFSRASISIRKGREQSKPEVAPLHIQNPFETSLNVSKNVNASQLDRFVALCQESSWLLQQRETVTPGGGNAPAPWGLAALLQPSQVAGIKTRKRRRTEPASQRIKSLLESLKNQNHQKKS